MDIKTGEILNDLLTDQIKKTLETFLPAWAKHVRDNVPHVKKNLLDFEIPKKSTCLIFSPGASMKMYEDKIHKLKDVGYVVGIPTALPWMIRHGLTPDVVVAQDASSKMHEYIELSGYKGPVIVPTYIHPDVSARTDAYFYNIMLKPPVNGMYDFPIDVFMQLMFSELPNIPSLGHVTGGALSIMHGMTVSKRAWFKRYVLIGADYAYWNGLGRVPIEGDYPEQPKEHLFRIDGKDTDYKMALYKHRLYMYWRGNMMDLYTVSDGLLHEIPHVTIDDVLARTYPSALKEKEVRKVLINYVERLGKAIMDEENMEREK